MDVLTDLVNEIIREHYVYIEECEEKSTDNERNISILRANTKRLQASIELMEKRFNNEIIERDRLFTSASRMLDIAIEKGDVELAQIAIKTIEIVQKKSPF